MNKSKVLRTAEKYVLQGKLPAAIDEYRKVVDADPADLTTINTLGDLYVRAGRIQDAIYNFSRIADSYRDSGFTLKAIAMLKKISKLDPTNVETAMKLANLYSQQGLLVEARQQYLQVADAYARAGQTRKALDAYQKIADLDPTNTSVRMKLGEIYSRERMVDQAHESFIMAGTEFLRKGDTEQALNANLKAIAINPESRQGLTAIASIYTQQGQADRAINLLCDAFEKNPGDVELLTILGRTYLSAGFMDNAERTFLSLIELDRNRYHYLLEVGRRFLQMGELDRAAEQIDGILEVLIVKREEDKAIDFLRRVLERDMNHLGSLKRLSQIFLRIREDHNLIATLNSLAEAAMRKGNDDEAIAALRELARLEPDEPIHRQRLYNLGVHDLESDAADVVRATGPLDYESAAFDDAFVIRQISEAEILAGHGQVEHAVAMLKEILNHTPENVQVHLKLKDIYLRAGMMDNAAVECVELARIHEARGETARSSDYLAEARQLDPAVEPPRVAPPDQSPHQWSPDSGSQFGFQADFGDTFGSQAAADDNSGFEVREATGGLDLSRYQTGQLSDMSGFVTVPDGAPFAPDRREEPAPSARSKEGSGHSFRFSDALVSDEGLGQFEPPTAADKLFQSVGNVPSDTMTPELHDELEGIDFYIAQGYVEIARDTLDRLRAHNGDHPEILARYKRLGVAVESPSSSGQGASRNEPVRLSFDHTGSAEEHSAGETGPEGVDIDFGVTGESVNAQPGGFNVMLPADESEEQDRTARPFLVHKESGPLQKDLIVQLNTSELLSDTAFDLLRSYGVEPIPEQVPEASGDLIGSMPQDAEASFGGSQQEVVVEWGAGGERESAGMQAVEIEEEKEPGDELQQIFKELKENTGDLTPLRDYETYYSLGLAYKDMELLDEAIEQFQMAFRMAGIEDLEGSYIQCCHMLGVCFQRKEMYKVAVMWFQRGLKIPNRAEDEYQALRYEIGLCYEAMGETDKAIDAFMEVYGTDLNYRRVNEKIKELQALKNA